MVGSDDDDDADESCPPPLVDSSEAASGDGSSGASEAASDEAWLADASRLEVVMRPQILRGAPNHSMKNRK